MDAPREDISERVNMCRLRSVRWVERGIKWWKVNGMIRSHNYALSEYFRGPSEGGEDTSHGPLRRW